MKNYDLAMAEATQELERAEFLVVSEIIVSRALRSKAARIKHIAEEFTKRERSLVPAHDWPPT
jgi:hypothetical protein